MSVWQLISGHEVVGNMTELRMCSFHRIPMHYFVPDASETSTRQTLNRSLIIIIIVIIIVCYPLGFLLPRAIT